MRTLVDIGEKEIEALDQMAVEKRVSRAALIRKAIKALLEKEASATSENAFGSWGASTKDGLEYQEELRREW